MKMYGVCTDGIYNGLFACDGCFTEEDFSQHAYCWPCASEMSFGNDCEGCREYAEWFWDFYGSDVYDDFDESIEHGCGYKVIEYIF